MLTSKKKGYRLSPETVDLLSQEFADSLTEAEADRKDILRLRLSLEEILESWSSALPGAGHLLREKTSGQAADRDPRRGEGAPGRRRAEKLLALQPPAGAGGPYADAELSKR